jgi:hypothetical protein
VAATMTHAAADRDDPRKRTLRIVDLPSARDNGLFAAVKQAGRRRLFPP